MILGASEGIVVDMTTFDLTTGREIDSKDKFMSNYVLDTLLKCGYWLHSSKYDLCQRILPDTGELVCHYKGKRYTISVSDWAVSDCIFAIQDDELCYIEGNYVMKLGKKLALWSYEEHLVYSECTCHVSREKKPDDADCTYIRPSYIQNDVLTTFSTFKLLNNKVFVDDREYALMHWVAKMSEYNHLTVGGIDITPHYFIGMFEGVIRSEMLGIIDTASVVSRDDIIVLRGDTENTGIVFSYENSRYVFDLSIINDNYLYNNVVLLSLVELEDRSRYIRVQVGLGAYLDVSLDGIIVVNSAFNPTKICIKTELPMKQIKRHILLGDLNKLIKKVE